jgi:hypothetical protein
VVGSRDLDFTKINVGQRLDALRENVGDFCLVSGGARGVDTVVAAWARSRGLEVIELKADWKRYRQGAGMIRNSKIVEISHMVVAFWDGKSTGTKDTIDKTRAADKPCIVWEEE